MSRCSTLPKKTDLDIQVVFFLSLSSLPFFQSSFLSPPCSYNMAVWGSNCCGFNFSNYLEEHLYSALMLKPLLCAGNHMSTYLSGLPFFIPHHLIMGSLLSGTGMRRWDSRQKYFPPAVVSLILWGLALIRGPFAISHPWLATNQ